MTALRPDRPFLGAEYDLGDGLWLSPLSPEHEASALADMIARQEPWLGYGIAPEQMFRFLADVEPGAPRLAVRFEAALAGVLAVRTGWLRGPYIQLLALAPSAHGHGIGTRLLAFAETEARLGGDRNLWIAASDNNAGALRLYERAGFARVADLDGLVADGRAEILLRKRLFP